MGYETDRSWSDQYIPVLKRLIGPYLLETSSLEVDRKQAADLVVFKAKDVTVACRVRRHGYADRYPFEFTVRSHRDSGASTELEKLIAGWGDWMFYGHATQAGIDISRWWLLDLAAWRAGLIRKEDRAKIRCTEQSNGDGTHFVAFDVRSFPTHAGRPLVIAASHEQTRAVA